MEEARKWHIMKDSYIKNLSKSQVFVAHSFWVICQNVWRNFVELCMETQYWCTVLVHYYGRRKSTKYLEFTFSIKALSFHSRTSIRAHKHISSAWNGYTAENQEESFFLNEIAFVFWCHALWKLGSSNCFIFEMKHARGRNGNLYKKRYFGAKTLFFAKFLRPYGPVCVLAKMVTLRPWNGWIYEDERTLRKSLNILYLNCHF